MKAKEKVTFKLEFHATHVPQRGWDKLLVSLVSVDTGKVTSKTGKAPVKNGTCQWSEPLFESTLISSDSNGKDGPKELCKLVVSMGLSRFGLLGDATINLMDYLQTTMPESLSLPLQNCNSGSILHVKIQRMLPKSASREFEDQKDLKAVTFEGGQHREPEAMLPADNVAANEEQKPSSSNRSDSGHSLRSDDVPSTPLLEERPHGRMGVGDEEFMSLSSSASSSGRHETESGVYDGEFTSPETFYKSNPAPDNYSLSRRSSHSSPDANIRHNGGEWNSPESGGVISSMTSSYEDKNRWESQRRTRLHRTVSVAMPNSWEHDATQVAVAEIEALRQQLSNETKRSEEVHKKLSMLIAERDNIKQEMENLKSVETSPLVSAREEGSRWQHQSELQDELDYVKGINLNLSLQLEKTQESNSELLLEIQDLEKLLQEKELEKEENERESGNMKIEDSDSDSSKLVESLKKELVVLERKAQDLTEDNMDLLSQLKQANDKLIDKDETIAKLETKSSQLIKAIVGDSVAVDDLPDEVKGKLRVSEEARLLLEVESQHLLEKATKAEDDYANALDKIKKLEAAHQMLEQEKRESIQTLEKQLGLTEEQLSATVKIYNDVLQSMDSVRMERAELDLEMEAVLKAKELGNAQLCHLEEVNAMLEKKLCQEELNTSKLMQQSKEVGAKYLQLYKELDASQEQVKSMEQIIIELQTTRKDLENDLHCFQEKDRVNRSRVKELELRMATLEDETHSLKASRAVLEAEMQEMKSPKDRFKLQEDAVNWAKQSKVGVEENMLHFQETNMKGSRRPLEEKNSEANDLLQKQSSDLTWKLADKEMELQDLKTRVFCLEEELQRKANALVLAERKMKEQRDSLVHDGTSQVSYLTRSLSRANSRVGVNKPTIPPSREAKELSDLRSKVKLLEGELKRKAAELEESKEQLKEQYTQLSMRIEHLELANEELVKEHSNSKLDQALKELSSLQNQNAIFFQRENELLARLASQEALQCELETLKKEKQELESALSKFNAAAKGENILKRISTLETELAEVLESNVMYKTQLQSAFAKQQNVHAAALESLGSVDKVINDLAELKRKNHMLEDELCDMKERYFNMSLQFAEVEAEREELVMTIRNLRGTKKFVPLRSAIF